MSATYGFHFDQAAAVVLRPLGVRDATAVVELTDTELRVRFGPWRLRAPLADVAGVELTGAFRWAKVIGPRLSLADRGVTFGTNTRRGACVRFARPVAALDPLGLLRHPAVTVTLADPQRFADDLRRKLPAE